LEGADEELFSGTLEAGTNTRIHIEAMESDLDKLVLDENSIFFYQFVQTKTTL
jgi:hypothetical protein